MAIKKTSPAGTVKKTIIILALILLVTLAITGVNYYWKFFRPNVTGNVEYLYIRTGSGFRDVYEEIRKDGALEDTAAFLWAAEKMLYVKRVKPGKYRLREGMNNRKLINMLAAGLQEPVTLSFRNLRLKQQFAGFVAKKIEPDSTAIIHLLDSANFVNRYGFTTDNVYTMFLPNSYKIYWNVSPERFFERLYENYEKFWNEDRTRKAIDLGLSKIQVSILASIVDAEALRDDEMPTIAGLYLNRLRIGMRLESDPTVIFALNDFSIRRVLSRDLRVASPYNTYLYAGLPPGPIMMPSINAIDAVLEYEKNNYIYMCAKEDFSGYHNFATNVAEHNANAQRFREALNRRNIKR